MKSITGNILEVITRLCPTFAETGGSPWGPGKMKSMAISLGGVGTQLKYEGANQSQTWSRIQA